MQTFSTPSVQSVIRHKWELYGRTQIILRSTMYLVYTLTLTVFAIVYSKVRHVWGLANTTHIYVHLVCIHNA